MHTDGATTTPEQILREIRDVDKQADVHLRLVPGGDRCAACIADGLTPKAWMCEKLNQLRERRRQLRVLLCEPEVGE